MQNSRVSAAHNTEIGIIVLAAGASRRMNRPKQMLEFDGRTLLRRAAETALASIYRPVVVVLGANFEQTREELEDLPVEIVFNAGWPSGLSSSVKTGIAALLRRAPNAAAALVTLADQPFVTAAHLNRFAEVFDRSKDSVIAAEYADVCGVPALFAREVFFEFDALTGDKGARTVIEKLRASRSVVSLPEAAFDIDTPEDFAKLKG